MYRLLVTISFHREVQPEHISLWAEKASHYLFNSCMLFLTQIQHGAFSRLPSYLDLWHFPGFTLVFTFFSDINFSGSNCMVWQ